MARPRRRGRQEDCWVIWPSYFDSRLSRKEGRRVGRELAVRNPKLAEMTEAIETLGLKAKVDVKASHPAAWHASSGRLKVTYPGKRGSKEELLNQMGQTIREQRKNKQG